MKIIGRLSAKICALAVVVALALSAAAVSAYAFFTSETFKTISGNISQNGVNVKKASIYEFSDLFKYSVGTNETEISGNKSINGIFNDSSEVADSSERVILTLENDIALESDITISSDAHLNLNGHTLYLNGFELVVSHTYRGNSIISGGTVVPDTADEGAGKKYGKIYFDVPYALPLTENLTVKTRANDQLEKNDYILNVSDEERVIAYNALYAVALKLTNATDYSARLLYSEILGMTDDEFSSVKFFSEKLCASNGDNEENCAFVFGDLDLPLSVKAYTGVTINYSSDNPSLSSFGKITFPVEGDKTANLAVTVLKNGNKIGETAFKLHLIDPSDSESLLSAGKSIAEAYLHKFRKNAGAEGTPDYVYELKRSLQLPKRITVKKTADSEQYIELSYKAFSDRAAISEITGATRSLSDFVCEIEPTSAMRALSVTVKSGTAETTSVYSVIASDSGLIRTDASYAQDFVIDNYGGEILINARVENGVYLFDTVTIRAPKSEISYGIIESVTYSLINDANSLYRLENSGVALTESSSDSVLTVREGKNPFDYVQTVQLDCVFTFKNRTETANVQIPVRCKLADGDNPNEFLIYYNYYDQMFFSTTGCYTIKDFSMPFATGSSANDYAVCYDMVVISKNESGETTINANGVSGITVRLSYGGTVTDVLTPVVGSAPYDGYPSYVPALENYLSANGLTVADIAKYGDAKWLFSVDTDEVGDENTDFRFVYNRRKMSGAFTPFRDSSDVLMTTSFTLPGVLKRAKNPGKSGVVSDESLFNWLGYAFGGASFSEDGSVILTDWLRQNYAVDVNDTNVVSDADSAYNGRTLGSVLKSASDFSGLAYLKGATKADLSGVNLSGAYYGQNIAAISGMTALEELSLKNCGLSSGVSSAALPDDSVLSGFSALKNLKTLHVGNNPGTAGDSGANAIFSFAFLLDIPSLNKVYVYENLDSSTVNGVFYGSSGIVNAEFFDELVSSGVSVYTTVSNTGAETLFTETPGVNDYKILKSIEYQKKLIGSTSITEVYKDFGSGSSAAAEFGFKTSYTVGTNSLTVTGGTLEWGYEGDETSAVRFYASYSFTLGGTSVSMKAWFTVVRVAEGGGV